MVSQGASRKPRRIAVVDREKCQPKKCGYRCIKICPVYRFNKEVIKIDEEGYPIISDVLCQGCGLCAKVCPYGAIKIVNLPTEQEDRLVHKYPTGFRLYGLPSIKENTVIGIIGRNGIGKTTSVKILSGLLIPNFGNVQQTPTKEQVLERFRRTSYYNYFEKLYSGEIKVVVKPQNISAIPKLVKGTVRDVIQRYDETGTAREILQLLEMESILDRKVTELSGGGLQALAITVALSREADVLFLDEPSVYLDIRRRLKLAELVDAYKKPYTYIVDHDLVVLDYVAEYINILYGEPAAFGVYSGLKTVKNGINEFLEGYLKEENVLIRNKAIRFDRRPRLESSESEEKVIVEYSYLRKSFDGFVLEIEPGRLYSQDIVAILGPNSIGKTTFVRMLAGELRPDEGQISRAASISYKPQEISYPEDEKITVRQFLGKIDDFVRAEVLRPMELDRRLELPVSSLSGGELQMLWIAKTLAADADIYILDEPSAFLDVEMRVQLAKILASFIEKKKKAMVIVDHDLQLLDYVCSKAILFQGTPGVYGKASTPMKISQGLNEFLKSVGITFRRDAETYRLRANKLNSFKDREQKQKGIYYPE